METVRLYEMPDCKMVSSGVGMFGEEKFDAFDRWFSAQGRGLFPKDFLFSEGAGFHWLYLYEEGMEVPAEFDIIDFKGGLYAVITDIDGATDQDAMNAEIDRFLSAHGLVRDPARPSLGNIITSPIARDILGYEQMEYYTPVKKA
ncbi:MAG: AraC family transcriptional regulator [Ruminococcaceae bacterium]|nr:AraC family transcriptional regulator [Oscillospiraceae bacterium]